MTRKRLAIIGNGMAAGRLLDELLRRDATARVRHHRVRRGAARRATTASCSAASSAAATPDEITLKPPEWYAERGRRVPRRRRASTRLDTGRPPARHRATARRTPTTWRVRHRQLAARPAARRAEVRRRHAEGRAFRVPHGRRLRARSASVRPAGQQRRGRRRRAARAGSREGALRPRPARHRVHLVRHADERAGRPARRRVPPRGRSSSSGIFVRTGTSADEVLGDGRVEAVRLRTGEVLPADLVVFACGIRPARRRGDRRPASR